MANQSPFSLKYLPMTFSFLSIQEADLPSYLGSTLRGAIGKSLLHSDQKTYSYLYQNRAEDDSTQRDITNPYILIPPLHQSSYHPGECMNFEIYLFGDAITRGQALINALSTPDGIKLGAPRFQFKLVKVVYSEDRRVIWDKNILFEIAARGVDLLCAELSQVTRATIQTLTPLRIRHNGTLLETVDFPTLIRNITRRVEAITTRYGGWLDKAEAARLEALSAKVDTVNSTLYMTNLERYSNRLKQKMDFSGLMGQLVFEGDITPFVPLLNAARVLHIGRNTTFGMGRISLELA
jgi:CRISPR-associated endoribonuclease Cas6